MNTSQSTQAIPSPLRTAIELREDNDAPSFEGLPIRESIAGAKPLRPEPKRRIHTSRTAIRDALNAIPRATPTRAQGRLHEMKNGKPSSICFPELKHVDTQISAAIVLAERRSEIISDEEIARLNELQTECERLLDLMTKNAQATIHKRWMEDRDKLINDLQAGAKLQEADLKVAKGMLELLVESARDRWRIADSALQITLNQSVWPLCTAIIARIVPIFDEELQSVVYSEAGQWERFGVPYEPSRLAIALRDFIERAEAYALRAKEASNRTSHGDLHPRAILAEVGITF